MKKSYYTQKKLFLLSTVLFSILGASATSYAQAANSPDNFQDSSGMPAQTSTSLVANTDSQSSFGVGYGQGHGAEQVSIMYTSPVMWTKAFDNSRLTLRIEGQLAQWHYKEPGSVQRDLTQISVVPLFAWELTQKFSLKGGIGLAYFNRHDFGDRTLGTKLNFADIVGAGYKITPHSEIAYYYTHYSNAGIKKPNPGLDLHKIVYNHSF